MLYNSLLIEGEVNFLTSLYIHDLLKKEYTDRQCIIYDKDGSLLSLIREFNDIKGFKSPRNSLLLFDSLGTSDKPIVLVINGLDRCHTHILKVLKDLAKNKLLKRRDIVLVATVPSLSNKKLKKQIEKSGVFTERLTLVEEERQFFLKSHIDSSLREIPIRDWVSNYYTTLIGFIPVSSDGVV